MPPIGTTRGYGSDPEEDEVEIVSPHEEHEDEEHGHGHAAPVNPDWIDPTDSTFDDVYITSSGKAVDPLPIGRLWPNQVLDSLIPPPHAYEINLASLFTAGFWATMVFTPIFYTLYFGYKDNCFDLGLLLGSLFAPALDWTTRLIGLAIHFGIGVIAIPLTYALILLVLRTQSSGGRGTQFGIGLCFAMCTFGLTMFVAFVSRFAVGSPQFDMPDFLLQQAGPANVGYAPFVVALIAHMFYGVLLGGLYRHKVVLKQSDARPLPA